MPPGHSTEGLDAALTIRKEFPEIGIVLLSAFVHAEHAVGLLSSGQRIGYLLKDRVEDVAEFAQSLRRVVDGGVVVDPDLVQDLLRARPGDDPLDALSAREREVLAEGRSNAGIAHQIWICEATVEKHVHSILGKLNLPQHRRPQASAGRAGLPQLRRKLTEAPVIRRGSYLVLTGPRPVPADTQRPRSPVADRLG